MCCKKAHTAVWSAAKQPLDETDGFMPLFLNHNVFRCGYNAHMQSACMAANHGIAAVVHPLRYGAGEKQKGYAKSRPAILRAAWAICIRVPVKALILSRVAHREMLLYPCPAALLLPPHFLPVPFCICS